MLLILLSNLLAGSVHCASVNEISKEYKSKFTNAEWDGNPTACVVKPYCYSHQKSNFMSTLKKTGKDATIESSFLMARATTLFSVWEAGGVLLSLLCSRQSRALWWWQVSRIGQHFRELLKSLNLDLDNISESFFWTRSNLDLDNISKCSKEPRGL